MDVEKDGFPVTCLRELKLLKALDHPNIVKLKEVVTDSSLDGVFLVFEFCDHDFSKLFARTPESRPFTIAQTKSILTQLLLGLKYLHERCIMHRDIKLSNLLYNDNGFVKLCDFGLARYVPQESARLSPTVATLWYRPPELLLGSDEYDCSLDIWAIGCVMGELLSGQPLFPGETEIECLKLMCELLGTPSETVWKGYNDLPNAQKIILPYHHSRGLKHRIQGSNLAIDLLYSMLCYDPKRRITASEALHHPFFEEDPTACPLQEMPRFKSQQAFNLITKKRKGFN
eukprot:g4722.t1